VEGDRLVIGLDCLRSGGAELLFLVEVDQLGRFFLVEEQPFRGHELDPVPREGVMGGSDHNSAVGAEEFGHDPNRGGRGDADIYDFTTSREKPGVEDSFNVL